MDNVSTSENVDIKPHNTKQNSDCSSAFVLSATGACCYKKHRFVKYTPKKCFNSFVQAAVDERRKSDENPNSSVLAETMKLLANSSYGYQIIELYSIELYQYPQV